MNGKRDFSHLPSAYSVMLRQLIAGVGAIVLSAGCSGTPPTGPGATLVSIAIEPATLEIGVGTSIQLTVRGQYSNGNTEAVAATWTVTPNSVATVTAGGEVFGVRLGIATVRAVHSSGLTAAAGVNVVANPAIPIPPVSNMSGVWSGQYTLDVCRRVSGDGPESCRFLLGSRPPISLQMTESGARLNGQLVLNSSLVGPVNGWRDAFGFHVLFGTLTGEDHLVGFTFELTKWDAKTTIATNSLTGTFEGVQRSTSAVAGAQVYIIGGAFLDVKR